MLSFKHLYILGTGSLSDMCFAKIFSQSVSLFILFNSVIHRAEVFNVIKYIKSIFCLFLKEINVLSLYTKLNLSLWANVVNVNHQQNCGIIPLGTLPWLQILSEKLLWFFSVVHYETELWCLAVDLKVLWAFLFVTKTCDFLLGNMTNIDALCHILFGGYKSFQSSQWCGLFLVGNQKLGLSSPWIFYVKGTLAAYQSQGVSVKM